MNDLFKLINIYIYITDIYTVYWGICIIIQLANIKYFI